jgi:hypothetical protein
VNGENVGRRERNRNLNHGRHRKHGKGKEEFSTTKYTKEHEIGKRRKCVLGSLIEFVGLNGQPR